MVVIFMKFRKFIYVILFSNLFLILTVSARDNEVDLKITGNILLPPPCKINQGSNVDVNFGDVLTKSIKGLEQKREINYQIECGYNNNNWDMYLSVNGIKSDFDKNGLKTNIDNLAVKFSLDHEMLELGKKYRINENTLGTLWAILIKKKNSELPSGYFFATGTLLVEYK